ncbi:phospholipase D family protein [Sulfuricurvum sp.]|uniref:phospholipase D family protein n=1 Tax=Sulfuricurvum sp. TaxID=2025608 RepID=UPI00286DEAF0|nr:phospholipase D family protein [Sulfuricurvum sp.]
MPTLDFLLQGMQPRNHRQVIHELLELSSPNEVLISVAFLRDNGFQLIKDKLSLISPEKVKFYVGVRNDITSMQGVLSILQAGYSIYVVDTGASDFIYHPKVYLSQNDGSAKVIIGSSNLTQNGLVRNIEASVLVELNKTHIGDVEFLNKITSILHNLPSMFPDNVTQITGVRQIIALKNNGILIDERISLRKPSLGVNTRTTGERERTPRMDTNMENLPRTRLHTRNRRRPAITTTPIITTTSIMPAEWVLVWTSSPLTERYLSIPTGTNTHATGSMGMTKGETVGIDQRHYFRDVVFHELNWIVNPSPTNPDKEVAVANMYLTIKGIDYPQQSFNLTHDPRTNTRTYQQNNFVTGLQWGSAKPLIAQRDLLGSKIRLYKRTIGTTVEYLMQFD